MVTKERKIKFIIERIKTNEFHNPLKDFKLDSQFIEIRKDPLTGRRSRINTQRSLRPRQESGLSNEIIGIIKESRKDCMFCKKNIDFRTPEFTDRVITSGRIKHGDCVLFPNLFPFGKYHAVGTLSEKHIADMSKLNSENFIHCFEACIDYFRRINKIESAYVYPLISLNFLPPSGSSIIHPHVQALIEKEPYEETDLLIEKSRSYYEKNSSNYWKDLVEIEKINKTRYIGKIGTVEYVTSFAPRSANEVIGVVFSDNACITELKKEEIEDLSLSLSKIFKAFTKMGFDSFNTTLYSGPLNESVSEYFSIIIKVISRPSSSQYYTNDKGFMEVMLDEPVISSYPEKTAELLKRHIVSS